MEKRVESNDLFVEMLVLLTDLWRGEHKKGAL